MILPALDEAALKGLALLGADSDSARAHVLGRRSLEGAPAIDPAALAARGFTDHEIAAVEAVLPAAVDLRAAFSPAVVGVGFVCDVLGAAADDAEAPGFDTLALAGFTPVEITAAEAWALGTGELADAPFLDEAARAVFLGEAETPPEERFLAMAAAMDPFTCSPPPAPLALSFADGPEAAVALQSHIRRRGGPPSRAPDPRPPPAPVSA